MKLNEIVDLLKATFPEIEFSLDENQPEQVLTVPVEALTQVAEFLCKSDELVFDALMCLSGIEYEEDFQVIYHLHSMKYDHKLALRCSTSKENPEIPSVAHVWAIADWHEREAFDMYGIRFSNHPDLRRILCPDDWEGYPLRKDYVPPKMYHDIPVTIISDNGDEG